MTNLTILRMASPKQDIRSICIFFSAKTSLPLQCSPRCTLGFSHSLCTICCLIFAEIHDRSFLPVGTKPHPPICYESKRKREGRENKARHKYSKLDDAVGVFLSASGYLFVANLIKYDAYYMKYWTTREKKKVLRTIAQ